MPLVSGSSPKKFVFNGCEPRIRGDFKFKGPGKEVGKWERGALFLYLLNLERPKQGYVDDNVAAKALDDRLRNENEERGVCF